MTPSGTSTEPGRLDAIDSALERLLSSEVFQRPANLRHLLKYLVTKAREGHPEQIKESIIAIEVFARREDFDGRLDNIVRVQAHRLRKLLDAYYAGEGRTEAVRFSIPKGSYVPQFEVIEDSAPEARVPAEVASSPGGEPARTVTAPRRDRRFLWLTIAFLAGAVLSLILSTRFLNAKRGSDIPGAVKEIWGPVFEPGTKVIASFSNPAFLRVEHSPMYLLYRGPLSAPPGAELAPGENDPYIDRQLVPKGRRLHFSDGWTGIGEVMAVNRLTMLGAKFENSPTATPSRQLAPNDMREANVIFIGWASVAGTLAEAGLKSRPFYAAGDGRIVVRQPRAGEPASYSNVLNPLTGEVVAGYVLFSLLPGVDANHVMVCSSGLSTAATWAGIDYTTNAKDAAQLSGVLKAANGGKTPRYFQAIIRADFIRGTGAKPTLVAVRTVG
jgi:hypothetical protein